MSSKVAPYLPSREWPWLQFKDENGFGFGKRFWFPKENVVDSVFDAVRGTAATELKANSFYYETGIAFYRISDASALVLAKTLESYIRIDRLSIPEDLQEKLCIELEEEFYFPFETEGFGWRRRISGLFEQYSLPKEISASPRYVNEKDSEGRSWRPKFERQYTAEEKALFERYKILVASKIFRHGGIVAVHGGF